jgi:DNA-binding IclR family transcriptional regulator
MDQYPTAAPLSYTDTRLRQQVLRVLAQHPAGFTPGEIASQLGLTTSLARLLQVMAQEGLVRRITSEIYAPIARQHV